MGAGSAADQCRRTAKLKAAVGIALNRLKALAGCHVGHGIDLGAHRTKKEKKASESKGRVTTKRAARRRSGAHLGAEIDNDELLVAGVAAANGVEQLLILA